MKITAQTIKDAADRIAATNSVAELRTELNEQGYTEKQINDIIKQAKEKIKAEADDISEIQKELNIYRLNLTATNDRVQDKNKLAAIDILNKLNGLYTQKIELNKDFKFVLGDEADDGFLRTDIERENKRLNN
jgi:hypothetical protein